MQCHSLQTQEIFLVFCKIDLLCLIMNCYLRFFSILLCSVNIFVGDIIIYSTVNLIISHWVLNILLYRLSLIVWKHVNINYLDPVSI